MNIEEVHNLIKAGEGLTVEFKNSFSSKVIIALNAFINAKGGKVIIGVSDTGEINGVEQSKESLQSWLNEIKTKTEPSIIPDVECFEIDGKNVVVMNVAEFPIKPIAYQGRYYIRKNNSNHQLNATQIADMHLISLQYSWDSYSFPNIELSALSVDKIDKFINNINNTGRFSYKGDRWDVLSKLSLINDDKPTIAAVLLFAETPQRQHIRIGRFKSDTNIIDDRQITETLFTAAEDALTFIKNYIKIEYIFNGDIKRKERWEYPLDAIKESLLNAIVHRDYRNINDIQIKIFDDKITIFSPGELYGNVTTEQLLGANYVSSLRNKLIGEAFYLIGEIEKYGTGFIRIREALKDYPNISFSFEEQNGGTLTSYVKTTQETVEKTDQKTTQKTTQKTAPKTAPKTALKTAPKTAPKAVKEQILELLRDNPSYTKQDLMDVLGKASGTIKEHIRNLQKEGRLKRVGSAKGGHWEVIKKV